MTATQNPEPILDVLNSSTSDNIWQDVILALPGYDWQTTERLFPEDSSNFVVDGHVYSFRQGGPPMFRGADRPSMLAPGWSVSDLAEWE